MQRAIKFRAWVKSEKRYITDMQDFIPLIVTNKGVLKLQPQFEENYYEILPLDWFIIEQFTGLHDKNGVEIYEGDIVKAEIYKKVKLSEDEDYFGSDGYKREKSTDEWTIEYKERHTQGNGFYCYGTNRRFNKTLTKSTIINCSIEVIGNIHERSVENDE